MADSASAPADAEPDAEPDEQPLQPSAEEVLERVRNALFAALPSHPVEMLVALLEFICVQHSGSSFNPDNTEKAIEIAAFVNDKSSKAKERRFPVTPTGVASLAKLARHALGSSDGTGKSAEHQLWLLTSGALNTAAAICEFDGDPIALFEAVRKDAAVRGRYMQRVYAQRAMQAHLENPEASTKGLPAPDVGAALRRQIFQLGPCQMLLLAMVLLLAVVAATVVMTDSATNVAVSVMNALTTDPKELANPPIPTQQPPVATATPQPMPTLTADKVEL